RRHDVLHSECWSHGARRKWGRPWLRVNPDQRVAIKFDVFDNNGEGTNSTGVFTDGEFPSVPKSNGDVLIALSGTGIDLTSGDLFHAVITYHNGSLTIAITDTATGASFQKTISIDIPSVVGGSRAFVGFTGGTAGLAAVQTIYTWTFSGQGPYDFNRRPLTLRCRPRAVGYPRRGRSSVQPTSIAQPIPKGQPRLPDIVEALFTSSADTVQAGRRRDHGADPVSFPREPNTTTPLSRWRLR